MQTRKLFFLFSFAIIFTVFVGALVAKSKLYERDAAGVLTRETTLPDGASLINRHCARCHNVEWIKQTVQTQPAWENTLAQMEQMGVTLSDHERIVLIDYLIAGDQP